MKRSTTGCIQGLAIIALHTACAAAGPATVAMPAPGPAMQSGSESEVQTEAPADTPALPRVTIVATGGTIAGVSETRTSFQSYQAGEVGIDEMLAELRPEIDEVADVTAIQFGNRASGGYAIADFYDLTLAVEKALETADAVVVTSGTGSMDEFVYWLELTVQSQKPVVITGAMRPWTVIGSDAQANLFNAIVLAASGETRCFGTVLMLNDEFHAAKEAWKGDAYRLDTFVSRELGILGYIDELDVQTYRAPPRAQRCADPEGWMTPFDLSRISKDDLPRAEVRSDTRTPGWTRPSRRGRRPGSGASCSPGDGAQRRCRRRPRRWGWSSGVPIASVPAATTSIPRRRGCFCCSRSLSRTTPRSTPGAGVRSVHGRI